jgi:hypothetical protein
MSALPRPTAAELAAARWFKSRHSGAENECVEVADGLPGVVPVRDSKDPAGLPTLVISATAWRAFVRHIRH